MALKGKLSTEIPIKAPASKWFHLFATKLYHVQNLAERLHHTKLHEGEDWHHKDTIKQWTYEIDGKVLTCKEKIEAVDEENKTITYILFGGDISPHYKVFKFIFHVIEKEDGSAYVNWTLEYEKIDHSVEHPYGYVEYLTKSSEDVDANLLKA
ncbi:hypothetical protein TanjilG_15744 [Lupinus angustifolius]|uniref:Putative mlp-like protein 43 n=1 Tax=Lupinus angustifolius TaxID=3871 RepID=A0A182BF91_LUPAN|nr:PREDICTED: MLP-like protein 43 [Lupinus angustifolius]AMK47958.1 putative mlp-like protein 43 [Lupinus angustifolius]OIW14390.1 hypothetical protein TanjilG_15744 [Lupinus angustifolius]